MTGKHLAGGALLAFAPFLAGAVLGPTLAGCEAVLGLGSETALPEAAPARDAGTDAPHDAHVRHDAGTPPSGAVVVSSNSLASNWCAVTKAGDVECWGNNENGELGDGTTTRRASPVKVVGLKEPMASVSVGTGTVCALARSGAAYCWGIGIDGELGDGNTTAFSSTPVRVTGLESGVTAISAGWNVACAVQAGKALCWGDEMTYMLGSVRTTNALVPTLVPGLDSGVTEISVGIDAACAVQAGAVHCWGGFGGRGDLGNGTTTGSLTPVAVRGLTDGVEVVTVGGYFACALEKGGRVLCWGDGTHGALGDGQLAVSPTAVQVQGLTSGVLQVSAGAVSACAIEAGGTVACWGNGTDGELGTGMTEPDATIASGGGSGSSTPVRVKGLSGPAVSESTGQAPCVATSEGKVECWGIVAEDALTPVSVTGLSQVGTVTAAGNLSTEQFACAVSDGGLLSCWGANGSGELGTGTKMSSTSPVVNPGVSGGATSVSGGAGQACGVSSGLAYCWGDNRFGQLGNGTTKSSVMPVAVGGLPGPVLSVSTGSASSCAIVSGADVGAGGALYCWGDNTYGELGNGGVTSSLVPVPVPALGSGVTGISANFASWCASLSDGTADCWGDNGSGQLGDGTMTTRLVPTKVVGLVGVNSVSVGWFSSCAVATGSIWCWGDNSYGELGSGFVPPSLIPVPVFGIASGATRVSVGQTSACAVVDGGAYCWGLGPVGNDQPPVEAYISPVPVTGLASGVTEIAAAAWFACAVADGGVRCWGFNTAGELGNAGAVDAFTPVRVPGFP
jgi:alpha-tubulin suppressor-like RCC1 family protein